MPTLPPISAPDSAELYEQAVTHYLTNEVEQLLRVLCGGPTCKESETP